MSGPKCSEARENLRALHAGRLTQSEQSELREHLAGCAECRAEDAAERALSEALETRLPRPLAPSALHQRLAHLVQASELQSAVPAHVQGPKRGSRSPAMWAAATGALLAAAAILLIVVRPPDAARDPLLHELVNDHLRVLYAQKPIEIESGGIHQVKPWFEGRVDFAPRVPFDGDAEFPLVGGAVGYVIDRKAATLVFKRRLHTITLFVFRAEGLPWPHGSERHIGSLPAQTATLHGFNTIVFRSHDLGYALVSDLNMKELGVLAAKFVEP